MKRGPGYVITAVVVVIAIVVGTDDRGTTAVSSSGGASSGSECHPSYDPCLDPSAADYDCEGGQGNGPMYTGAVAVVGRDDYGLDRDGDGTGCEF